MVSNTVMSKTGANARRKTIVATLLGAGLPNRQIAEKIGVAQETVSRIKKRIDADLTDAAMEYRDLARAELSDALRVGRLRKAIEDDDGHAAIKAIMYADRVLGVAPAEAPAPQATQAMFVLPAGTRVAMVTGPALPPARPPEETPE